MKSSVSSGRVGAVVIALGALLILCGNLLPSKGDYQFSVVDASSFNPQALSIAIGQFLILFATSIYCWSRRIRGSSVTIGLILILGALISHCFLQVISRAVICMDWCPPSENLPPGTGFWLPLAGYLLSGTGLLITYIMQKPQY